MKNKNFSMICFSAIFICLFALNIDAQEPCPDFDDLLNLGWAALPGVHNPNRGNFDEFAVAHFETFLIKVNDYPPVRSFPMILYSDSPER